MQVLNHYVLKQQQQFVQVQVTISVSILGLFSDIRVSHDCGHEAFKREKGIS